MRTLQGHKYRWILPEVHRPEVVTCATRHGLVLPIAQVLMNRGLQDDTTIRQFLVGAEKTQEGVYFKDAERAVDRIIRALTEQEKILIAGDYDVDGITSTALLLHCLKPLGAQINFFIPNRIKDGYGLSATTIEKAAAAGYRIVITVDNGITAHEPARIARERGIDLIITDHHRPQAELPDAYAVIDPHREDCPYPFKSFAGVGVSFKLMELLYARLQKTLPDVVYELLTLGTIADVVPLIGENRYWVKQGLARIATRESLALSVLKSNVNFNRPRLSATDIGFFIAPQINALGRLDEPRAGVTFFLSSDPQLVEPVGKRLCQLNETRKELERSVVTQVSAQLIADGVDPRADRIIIVVGTHFPPGVVGLVASRLVGMHAVPALVLHETAGGILKGSCRSIAHFDMVGALTDCADILLAFGGHAMAAGLSLRAEHLGLLRERLIAYAHRHITPEDMVKSLVLDAELALPEINKQLMHDLGYLEPCGAGNPQPLFWLRDVTFIEPLTLLKQVHVKGKIFSEGVIKTIIFFNRPDIYEFMADRLHEPFDCAAQVTENYWNGNVSLELQGLDISLKS